VLKTQICLTRPQCVTYTFCSYEIFTPIIRIIILHTVKRLQFISLGYYLKTRNWLVPNFHLSRVVQPYS